RQSKAVEGSRRQSKAVEGSRRQSKAVEGSRHRRQSNGRRRFCGSQQKFFGRPTNGPGGRGRSPAEAKQPDHHGVTGPCQTRERPATTAAMLEAEIPKRYSSSHGVPSPNALIGGIVTKLSRESHHTCNRDLGQFLSRKWVVRAPIGTCERRTRPPPASCCGSGRSISPSWAKLAVADTNNISSMQ